MVSKIIKIHIPEYTIKSMPNYLKIGKKVDKVLEKNFQDGKYILRAIGSEDHPNLSLKKLVEIILKNGTDKYDPKIKGVCHDEFCEYDYDIQAITFEIKNSKIVPNKGDKYSSIVGGIIYNFYENAPKDRGYSVRIDLLLVYDFKRLMQAKKINHNIKRKRRGLDKHLYKFKYPKNKKDALLGIIKILK